MDKKLKIGIGIFVVIAVFAIIILCYEIFKEAPANTNTSENFMVNQDQKLDNVINQLFDNSLVDEKDTETNGNVIQEPQTPDNPADNGNKSQGSTSGEVEGDEAASNAGGETTTPKEEEAIRIAKEDWGEDDSVYFINEAINQDGRYIVRVSDKKTQDTLAWYFIDVETGKFYRQ